MKYVLTFGVVAVMATGVAIGCAQAQTKDTWIYDQRGNHVGTAATDSAGNTRYYNDRGNTVGTSSPTGEGGRNYYDSRGNRTGSTSRSR
jgi:YD repeat-containing protein